MSHYTGPVRVMIVREVSTYLRVHPSTIYRMLSTIRFQRFTWAATTASISKRSTVGASSRSSAVDGWLLARARNSKHLRGMALARLAVPKIPDGTTRLRLNARANPRVASEFASFAKIDCSRSSRVLGPRIARKFVGCAKEGETPVAVGRRAPEPAVLPTCCCGGSRRDRASAERRRCR